VYVRDREEVESGERGGRKDERDKKQCKRERKREMGDESKRVRERWYKVRNDVISPPGTLGRERRGVGAGSPVD